MKKKISILSSSNNNNKKINIKLELKKGKKKSGDVTHDWRHTKILREFSFSDLSVCYFV